MDLSTLVENPNVDGLKLSDQKESEQEICLLIGEEWVFLKAELIFGNHHGE